MNQDLKYQSGLLNHFESECLAGALPKNQNSPQKAPYGLYAEQINGSAFTAPRHENLKTWFYRIRPSVLHEKFKKIVVSKWLSGPFSEESVSPDQLRWDPLPEPTSPTDFIEGMITIAGNGSIEGHVGCGAHTYFTNKVMDRYFYNADGELLILPQKGGIFVRTECGDLSVGVCEVLLIPRGMKFQISPLEKASSGYVCENYGATFRLPGLGPIGANGLANPRHFLSPVAHYEDKAGDFKLLAKFNGSFFETRIAHSPLDVVAWSGNYAPSKYDLNLFNTINTVSFDHPDPSIFTVLTSPSAVAGTANIDFVIFPPRWMVGENTFRPPYYHRNFMSEFMGLLHGQYDAKPQGFMPGGMSLHNAMTAHGPDSQTFEQSSSAELKPQYFENTLAFMFESNMIFRPTHFAMMTPSLQKDYLSCWQGLKSHFDPKKSKV